MLNRRAGIGDVLLPGAIGGLLAGAAVALWLLVIDVFAGQPLATPAVLGQILLQPPEFEMTFRLLAGYTILHFGAFVILGIAAAWFVRTFHVAPGLLVGLIFGVIVLDVVYYGALLITGANVVDVLAWYQVVPANALAGAVLMAYLHRVYEEPQPLGWGVLRGQPLLQQGVTAGLIGAAVVAAWFLIIDTIGGRPLHTPAALGSAMFFGAQSDAEVRLSLGLVMGYTMLHVAVFIAAGMAIAAAAAYLERQPSRALMVALTFIVMEAVIISAVLLGAAWVMGSVGLWAITGANVLAVVAMGWYVLRTHRSLPERLRHATVDV
jgi:hypothetical protein